MALLDSVRDVDVITVSHRGFESASHLSSTMRGELVGVTLSIHFSRHAAQDIPPGRDGVRDWLEARWLEVDAFASDVN